jgi:hypothetical protein
MGSAVGRENWLISATHSFGANVTNDLRSLAFGPRLAPANRTAVCRPSQPDVGRRFRARSEEELCGECQYGLRS